METMRDIRNAVCDTLDEWMTLYGRIGLYLVLDLLDTVEEIVLSLPERESDWTDSSGGDLLDLACRARIPVWASWHSLLKGETEDLVDRIECAVRESWR